MNDEFKRAQMDNGKGNYCACCDVHPDKCKKSQVERGKVRGRLKRDLRERVKRMNEEEGPPADDVTDNRIDREVLDRLKRYA